MVEAICIGLPVVTTKVSATEELIKDGFNGYLVEQNDVAGMAECLKKLMANEDQIESFSERNRELSHLFETGTIVDQWEELIKEVVANYKNNRS